MEENQRWTFRRKSEIILEILQGKSKLVDICRKYDLKQSEVQLWIDTFIKAGERGLKLQITELTPKLLQYFYSNSLFLKNAASAMLNISLSPLLSPHAITLE